MAIRFPRLHIAESVVNRILNAADELETRAEARQAAPFAHVPPVPDPSMQGAALDAALATPPADMPPVSDETEAALEPAIVADGLGL